MIFVKSTDIKKPGTGKTTWLLCRSFIKTYIYIPMHDGYKTGGLLITVIAKDNKSISRSDLVSAMINGGICILDGANRMTEKS